MAIAHLDILKHTGKLRTCLRKKCRSMFWNINKCKWWMRIRRITSRCPTIQNWSRTSCRWIDEESRRDITTSRINPWWKQIWRLMRHLRKRSRWFRSRGPSLRCQWCRRTRRRRRSRASKTLWYPSNRLEGSTKLHRRRPLRMAAGSTRWSQVARKRNTFQQRKFNFNRINQTNNKSSSRRGTEAEEVLASQVILRAWDPRPWCLKPQRPSRTHSMGAP